MAGRVVVFNKSNSIVHCFVSKYSRDSGDDEWFEINPMATEDWSRKWWELVAFKNSSDSTRGAVYVKIDHERIIEFHSFDDIRVIV